MSNIYYFLSKTKVQESHDKKHLPEVSFASTTITDFRKSRTLWESQLQTLIITTFFFSEWPALLSD